MSLVNLVITTFVSLAIGFIGIYFNYSNGLVAVLFLVMYFGSYNLLELSDLRKEVREHELD